MALTIKKTQRLGYLPDLPDPRDYLLKSTGAPLEAAVELQPLRHTIRKFYTRFPNPLDQGYLGSCVANAAGVMFQYIRNVVPRSRLQLYYEARRLIGMTEVDSGCYPRDMMKVTAQLGAGREIWWSYDDGPDKFKIDPPLKVDRDALLRRIMTYYRLEDRDDFRRCILENHPFIVGLTVFDEFVGYSTNIEKFGIVPLPGYTEKPQGGHAMLVIGYDDDFINSDWAKQAVAAGYPIHLVPKRVYIVRNSWGPNWGRKGDCAIDADYIESWRLCGDCWTQRKYEVGTNATSVSRNGVDAAR